MPTLTSQAEGRHAPYLPPLPPTHSGSGGRQGLALSPSFAACSRDCSRVLAHVHISQRCVAPHLIFWPQAHQPARPNRLQIIPSERSCRCSQAPTLFAAEAGEGKSDA
jgi:hypothetical protein